MTTIAKFSIDYVQCIDESAKLVSEMPAFAADHAQLLKLYELMVLNRIFDTKAINLQRTGKMGTYASTLGQEAVFVGIGHAMEKTDVLVPYYRDYAALLQRGATMTQILQYWGGDERGSDYHDCREDFPICVPIATQFLHATGVATAIKYRQQQRAVVVTGGEGATSEGDFYEALNVAGQWQLPVVFVINNNQWAISVARESQTGCQTIAQKAIAGGMPGIQVDGNDVVAMRDSIDKALKNARAGKGPTLIEAVTYRLCDHTTADDASRYVPKEAIENAWKKEPIKRMRAFLESQQLWDQDKDDALTKDCQQQVNQAVDAYMNLTPQPVTSIFDYMYETLPKSLQQQRDLVDR